jgi:hypothetical protein
VAVTAVADRAGGREDAVKLRKWFENVDLTKVKVNLKIVEMEWEPREPDREAAWELYIELLTRIVTQPLPAEYGDEKTALDSAYALFPITREILRRKGRDCVGFSRIAIAVLNQVVRPFTAKWHKLSLATAFDDEKQCTKFRIELQALQDDLRKYTRLLADIAAVEDLTDMASE